MLEDLSNFLIESVILPSLMVTIYTTFSSCSIRFDSISLSRPAIEEAPAGDANMPS